jgi:hypothetical protein
MRWSGFTPAKWIGSHIGRAGSWKANRYRSLPMVLLESQYLHELSRVSQGPALIVKELEKSLG